MVYSIPCKDCPKQYIGETGRKYSVREKEHQKDTAQLEGKKFTRAQKKVSTSEVHQSALTDHIAETNHTIDWSGVKLPSKDPDWHTRGIREAIHMCRAGPRAMNRDGGRHQLSQVFTKLLPVSPLCGGIRH